MINKILNIVFLFVISLNILACGTQSQDVVEDKFTLEKLYKESEQWVDSVMSTLSEDEVISQLFWLSMSYPTTSNGYLRDKALIEKYQPGGILIMRMKYDEAEDLIQNVQGLSKLPMIISMDGETGLGMRMLDVERFPRAMTLGAINNNELIYKMGAQIADEFKCLGVHVNMAPVADVNSNPINPVIGMRSFGENPHNVAEKAFGYMKGMQDNGIMAVAKHFPGHGDTSADSHSTLPLVNRSRIELDSVELVPFKALIDDGIWGVMSAHLQVPALNPEKGVPSSFSPHILDTLLKQELGFKGLVISDAINMTGAKFMGEPGEIDAVALIAGTDIVEFTENLPKAIESVKKSVKDSSITWQEIEAKCKKSLAFKYWLIEKEQKSFVKNDSIENVIRANSKELKQELYDASLTALRVLPEFFHTEDKMNSSTLFVTLGNSTIAGVKTEILNNNLINRISSIYSGKTQQVIIIEDGKWIRKSQNRALLNNFLSKVSDNTYFVFLDNPYFMRQWKDVFKNSGLILNYEFNEYSVNSMLKFLSGSIGASGVCPVTVSGICNVGDGAVVQ